MGWYDGMQDHFAKRLKAMIEASGGRISVFSGYRSVETQQELWDNALAKYGSEDAARQWVAPPGKSNHNHGIAADLGYETDDAQGWAHENAARFGLVFPMSWEPWHIETAEARGGTPDADGHTDSGGAEAYTTPPPGTPGVVDAPNRFDLGYQLQMLNGLLMNPTASASFLAGPGGAQGGTTSGVV